MVPRFSPLSKAKITRGIGILPMYSNFTGWPPARRSLRLGEKPVPQVAPGLHEPAPLALNTYFSSPLSAVFFRNQRRAQLKILRGAWENAAPTGTARSVCSTD